LTVFLAQEAEPESKVEADLIEEAELESPPAEEPLGEPLAEPLGEPLAEPLPRPPAPAYADMLVTATKSTRAAELALDTEIKDLGYLRGSTRNGRTQYFALRVWKPRVTVYEQGFVEVRGRRITPMAPISDTSLAGASGMPGVNAAPGVSGVPQSKRQANRQEDLVRAELESPVRDWQQATQAQALLERQLESRNTCGLSWEGEGAPELRREALAALWLNTSDTPEGAAIRGVVLGYIDEIVQASGTPYTQEDLDRINAAHSFEQPFEPIAP
jgi:hypothetical protein